MVLIFLPLLMHEIREWLLCRTIRSENISKCVFRSRLALSRFFFFYFCRDALKILRQEYPFRLCRYIDRSAGPGCRCRYYTRPAIRLSILWLFWHISTLRCSNLPNKVIILLAKFFFTSNVYTVRKNPSGVHHRIIEALMWSLTKFFLCVGDGGGGVFADAIR